MFRSPVHAGLTILGASIVALSGCARHGAARVAPPARIGATETGIASWYGDPYHGRASASGEIYDMRQFTAAHRTFPFGTWVEVTDLDNGKKVDVRVIDRGPFAAGRIIDLSFAAAEKIDMVGPGTARVRLKVIRTPASSPAVAVQLYAVQAGAFSTSERAESVAASLREKFSDSRVLASDQLWRVLVGRELPLVDAKRLAKQVRKETGAAMVVPDR